MVEFFVNNKKVTVESSSKRLIDFLREDLLLKSVKDGCSSGACGTCTIIIDGKAVRSCIVTVEKAEGKSIITTEGLTDREKEVYEYCFVITGAVQCCFCIPGMVMSGKALIDKNSSPTLAEVKKAIKGNICRCTGYKKIEEAILLAADFFRENKSIPKLNETGKVGEAFIRVDAKDKTLGTGKYVDDISMEEIIYGKALRTPVPRCKIIKINIDKALEHKDCVNIILKEDIPGSKKVGHLKKDWDVLIGEGEITRYLGDAIALVASRNYDTLKEIIDLIDLEYEELKPITCPDEARAENAPLIHEDGNLLKKEILHRGNPEEAIKNSKYVVTKKYSTPFTEHAFMEPETAIAMPHPTIDGGILLYSGGQGIYDEQHEVSDMLGISGDMVQVKSMLVGGGFGGKEDMSVQHHASLLAYILKKPVKVKLTRAESIIIHPKRHQMDIELTTGCDEKGRLTGMIAKIVSDTGAYASLGGPVLQRACTHAAGPYNYQNMYVEGEAYYTNNPPGGAFRGFGVCQSAFAMECNLDLLAEEIGISPWEIRYINAVRPGDILPNGQIADETTGLVECLDAVKEVFENNKYVGIASSFKNSGIGVGIPDTGRCLVSIENGKVHVRSSAACIGQGMATVSMQIACETTSLLPNDIIVEAPDTERTPNSGTTTASRQTVFTGEAVRVACEKLKNELDKGVTLKELEGKEFYGEYSSETDALNSTKLNPISHVAYGYAAQVVILDEEGTVKKVVAAHDVGQIINKQACEGQIEGGIVMGLGYALTEDYPLVDSVPTAKYGTLGLFRATDVPEMEIIIIDRKFKSSIAYGSKGVGELATIPTAPAVQNAYYKFDKKFRYRLPLEGTKYKK